MTVFQQVLQKRRPAAFRRVHQRRVALLDELLIDSAPFRCETAVSACSLSRRLAFHEVAHTHTAIDDGELRWRQFLNRPLRRPTTMARHPSRFQLVGQLHPGWPLRGKSDLCFLVGWALCDDHHGSRRRVAFNMADLVLHWRPNAPGLEELAVWAEDALVAHRAVFARIVASDGMASIHRLRLFKSSGKITR